MPWPAFRWQRLLRALSTTATRADPRARAYCTRPGRRRSPALATARPGISTLFDDHAARQAAAAGEPGRGVEEAVKCRPEPARPTVGGAAPVTHSRACKRGQGAAPQGQRARAGWLSLAAAAFPLPFTDPRRRILLVPPPSGHTERLPAAPCHPGHVHGAQGCSDCRRAVLPAGRGVTPDRCAARRLPAVHRRRPPAGRRPYPGRPHALAGHAQHRPARWACCRAAPPRYAPVPPPRGAAGRCSPGAPSVLPALRGPLATPSMPDALTAITPGTAGSVAAHLAS